MTGKEQLLAAAAGLHFVEIDGTGIEQGRTYKEKDASGNPTGLTKPLPGSQNGYLWQGDAYPIKVSINIPDGKAPYAPGLYAMTGAVFEAGKYSRLTFKGDRAMVLIPIADAALAFAQLVESETGEVVEFKKTGTK